MSEPLPDQTGSPLAAVMFVVAWIVVAAAPIVLIVEAVRAL